MEKCIICGRSDVDVYSPVNSGGMAPMCADHYEVRFGVRPNDAPDRLPPKPKKVDFWGDSWPSAPPSTGREGKCPRCGMGALWDNGDCSYPECGWPGTSAFADPRDAW